MFAREQLVAPQVQLLRYSRDPTLPRGSGFWIRFGDSDSATLEQAQDGIKTLWRSQNRLRQALTRNLRA